MRYLSPNRDNDFLHTNLADKGALAKAWHSKIAEFIQPYTENKDYARFLDPLAADATAIHKPIGWQGFPRAFDGVLNVLGTTDSAEKKTRFDRAHRSAENLYQFVYAVIDSKFTMLAYNPKRAIALYPDRGGKPDLAKGFALAQRPQDEYLEWYPVRDPATGRTTRLDFTSEAPEYWEFVADNDPLLLVNLYRKIHDIDIPRADLYFATDIYAPNIRTINNQLKIVGYSKVFNKNSYNPYNKWNTKNGAVHLTQRANSLRAEIKLAADATIKWPVRPDVDAEADRFELLACASYGGINRNSDPTIGFEVNSLALGGYKVTISNPIGLFIGEINLDKFRDPDGHQVSREKILTIHRGSERDEDGLARVLRFSVHPPVGANYGLESCSFDGFSLDTGGPIARETTVVIHGVAMSTTVKQPLGTEQGKACKHPVFQPDFYTVVAPGGACPLPGAKVWEAQLEAPVVPEQPLQILEMIDQPAGASASLMTGRR